MEFLSKNLKNVERYVAHECAKGSKTSKSMHRLSRLLLRHAVSVLEKQCSNFLDDCSVLHDALKTFSDLIGCPMATHVAPTLKRFFEYAHSEKASEHMTGAITHHRKRLEKNHNMDFWKHVMWFSPSWIVQFARPCRRDPISVALTNNLFDKTANTSPIQKPLFSISAEEWNEYVVCRDYEWNPMNHKNDHHWWTSAGRNMFPFVFVAAQHYIWTPPLLTKCDSWLSTLGYMYNSRQASLAPQVIAQQVFIRGNMDELEYASLTVSKDENSEINSDSTQISDEDIAPQ